LCSKPGTRYLEVGTYTGSSIISAMLNNKCAKAVGIDNWSLDLAAKDKLKANLKIFNLAPTIVEVDAFNMTKEEHDRLGSFDVYFYDGHHSAKSQENGILHFWPNLAKISIVIIDDYNIFRVQQGTIRAIDKLGCKQHLRYAWGCPGGKDFEYLYWGGLAVMVLEK